MGRSGYGPRPSPDHAELTAGVALADSWATDGHKWLQTPYDCGYAIVRDAEAHRRAMTIAASYLPQAEGAERDPSAYVPELSRRARGFATWAMIRQLGRAGIADMIDRHCRIARYMAERLAMELGIELVCPVELNQFMLRFGSGADADRLTLETVRRVQANALAFIGSARWYGDW
jgi:glutamate/tyrosine decarboxylase-like PLP-dependent enzyme